MIKILDLEDSFPNPRFASKNGLVAIGGDLSPQTLLDAYKMGIFPWYSEGDPILWWSPDPRMVLYPKDLKISRSLKKVLKKDKFEVYFNRDFEQVIRNCSKIPRKGQNGTWILPEIIEAYKKLYLLGYAQSVETYLDGQLVGGLYGVVIGKVFFGESMFSRVSDASKVAFVHLVKKLEKEGFHFIDCQVSSNYLANFGAVEIPRDRFLDELKVAVTLY
ncbi:MAG: leucyl/phenylalanyl-tRNA--protein transferase [Aquificae bacterium]|nr:leucyl/phenylalanyl-tRNA--protein transferase [Aquificota bacterium]